MPPGISQERDKKMKRNKYDIAFAFEIIIAGFFRIARWEMLKKYEGRKKLGPIFVHNAQK